MLEKSFCDVFKELRLEKNNMSQEAMAKELDVSPALISKWENNQSTPAPEMLEYIADYFDVSVDYLIGRTNDKRWYPKTEQDFKLAYALFELSKSEPIQIQLLCFKVLNTIIDYFNNPSK